LAAWVIALRAIAGHRCLRYDEGTEALHYDRMGRREGRDALDFDR
jgi:hypothetical protein